MKELTDDEKNTIIGVLSAELNRKEILIDFIQDEEVDDKDIWEQIDRIDELEEEVILIQEEIHYLETGIPPINVRAYTYLPTENYLIFDSLFQCRVFTISDGIITEVNEYPKFSEFSVDWGLTLVPFDDAVKMND